MAALDRLVTDRLVADPLRREDEAWLRGMHRDERLMATLGGLRSDEETARYLAVNLAHWERHGFGLFVLRDRVDGRAIGRGGPRHVEIAGRDEVELAYAFVPEVWGRGLATEFAVAAVRQCFAQLAIASLVAFTLPSNLASRRVMEKAGFTFEREVDHGGPHVLYRAHRPQIK